MSLLTFMLPKTHSVAKLTLCILPFLTPPILILATNATQDQDNRRAIIDVSSSSADMIHGLICIGQGADSTALGIIVSIIVLFVIGSSLWVCFNILS